MMWRVVITDSESESGVAPVCPSQHLRIGLHLIDDIDELDLAGVYDCCPQPHIECFSTSAARAIASILGQADAELCS